MTAGGCELGASARRVIALDEGEYTLRLRGNPIQDDLGGVYVVKMGCEEGGETLPVTSNPGGLSVDSTTGRVRYVLFLATAFCLFLFFLAQQNRQTDSVTINFEIRLCSGIPQVAGNDYRMRLSAVDAEGAPCSRPHPSIIASPPLPCRSSDPLSFSHYLIAPTTRTARTPHVGSTITQPFCSVFLFLGTRATVATWRFDVTELEFGTAADWASAGLDPSRNIVNAYHRGEFNDIAPPPVAKEQLFVNPAEGDTDRIVFLLIANRTADVDEPVAAVCNQSAPTQLFTDVVTGGGALKVIPRCRSLFLCRLEALL